jgi:hypothetical protein
VDKVTWRRRDCLLAGGINCINRAEATSERASWRRAKVGPAAATCTLHTHPSCLPTLHGPTPVPRLSKLGSYSQWSSASNFFARGGLPVHPSTLFPAALIFSPTRVVFTSCYSAPCPCASQVYTISQPVVQLRLVLLSSSASGCCSPTRLGAFLAPRLARTPRRPASSSSVRDAPIDSGSRLRLRFRPRSRLKPLPSYHGRDQSHHGHPIPIPGRRCTRPPRQGVHRPAQVGVCGDDQSPANHDPRSVRRREGIGCSEIGEERAPKRSGVVQPP